MSSYDRRQSWFKRNRKEQLALLSAYPKERLEPVLQKVAGVSSLQEASEYPFALVLAENILRHGTDQYAMTNKQRAGLAKRVMKIHTFARLASTREPSEETA